MWGNVSHGCGSVGSPLWGNVGHLCGSRLLVMWATFVGQYVCDLCWSCVSFGAIVLDEVGHVVGQLGDFCGSSWSFGLVIWVTVVGHLWHVCGSPVSRL